MSKWAMVGFSALMAVFCIFSHQPLTTLITDGLAIEPTNPGWMFLDKVFPIGWILFAFFFVILAIYTTLSED